MLSKQFKINLMKFNNLNFKLTIIKVKLIIKIIKYKDY
jgi:hypothetical protein